MKAQITERKLPDDGVVLDDYAPGTIMVETTVGKVSFSADTGVTPSIGIIEGTDVPDDASPGSVTTLGETEVIIGATANFPAGDYRFTRDENGHAVEISAGKYEVGRLTMVQGAPTAGRRHSCWVEPKFTPEP